jgi:hypothetical protein
LTLREGTWAPHVGRLEEAEKECPAQKIAYLLDSASCFCVLLAFAMLLLGIAACYVCLYVYCMITGHDILTVFAFVPAGHASQIELTH